MTQFYLVTDADGTTIIAVKANNVQQALDYFIEAILKTDDYFIEYLTNFTMDSLFSNFYKDDIGSFYHTFKPDEFEDRIKIMSEEQREKHMVFWIEKNVMNYFKDEPEIGEEYIQQFKKDLGSGNYYGNFSDKVLYKMAEKVVETDEFFGELEIIKVDLKHKKYQIIKDY